jgi:dTDP-4-dehydrorhamnose reductase
VTILIIGKNGQLGKALAQIFTQRKIPFEALGSQALDIRNAEKTMYLLKSIRPTIVINAAAWTNVDQAEQHIDSAREVNVQGAINLATASKNIDAVFVHISSDYVFSGVGTTPWRVQDEVQPLSAYGRTKAESELEVITRYSEGTYVFRTAWLYSQWGHNFAKSMTRLALSETDCVNVVGDQIGQPTSAIDLAKQISDTLIAQLPFGLYHATNSGEASWFDFAHEIFLLAGASTDRLKKITTREISRLAERPKYSVLSHDSWNSAGVRGSRVSPMRNWKAALAEIFPFILDAFREHS